MCAIRSLLSCGLALVSLGMAAEEDTVSRAMRAEMQRSMQKLQLEQLDKPYFISYLVVDSESKQAAASLGSLLSSSESRTRFLHVSVRVGDYHLDNSHFVSTPQMAMGVTQLPLDDDYNELRRQIWLATDRAYKQALEDLAGKRAALARVSRSEDIPDFSKAPAVSVTDLVPPNQADLGSATSLVRQLSALFRHTPSVETSQTHLVATNRMERYLNSEGTAFMRRLPRVSLRITAATQAPDGMPLSDFIDAYGYTMKDLPSAAALSSCVGEMVDGLRKLQAAPIEERYEGPVLFEGQAAAEVFARRFAALLPAVPTWSTSEEMLQPLLPKPQASLLDKIGLRVLPDFLTVVDDATVTHEGDRLLQGGYKVDDEGVPARRTVVVQQGVLKTVLTSREPLKGALESTANLREQRVVPSNLLVTSDRTSTLEELHKRLIESALSQGNHYGIVIRRLSGRTAHLAYRVYEDGHEELVRNGEIDELSSASFKNILAVSDQRSVYTETAPLSSAPSVNANALSGQPLVSYVVPSFLFPDVTLQKTSGKTPKPTFVSNPLAESQ